MRNVLNLVTKYDATDPNYPDGKFKDDSIPGDNTGTELIKTWPNDILGALYAIIRVVGGTTPNNNAEYPDQSQIAEILDTKIHGNPQFASFLNRDQIVTTLTSSPNDMDFFDGIIVTVYGTGSLGNGVVEKSSDGGYTGVSTDTASNSSRHVVQYLSNFNKWVVGGGNFGAANILTSSDATTWTTYSPAGSTIYGIIALNGFALAVGEAGNILFSNNLTTWTQSTPAGAYSGDFKDGSANGSIVVIVGTNGEIQTSSNTLTWTQRTPAGAYSGDFYSVAWYEKAELFVAMGEDGSGGTEIQTSPDGITWTQRTTPITVSDVVLKIICTDYGIFAIGNAVMIYSKDGINYIDATIPVERDGTPASYTTMCFDNINKSFILFGNEIFIGYRQPIIY